MIFGRIAEKKHQKNGSSVTRRDSYLKMTKASMTQKAHVAFEVGTWLFDCKGKTPLMLEDSACMVFLDLGS